MADDLTTDDRRRTLVTRILLGSDHTMDVLLDLYRLPLTPHYIHMRPPSFPCLTDPGQPYQYTLTTLALCHRIRCQLLSKKRLLDIFKWTGVVDYSGRQAVSNTMTSELPGPMQARRVAHETKWDTYMIKPTRTAIAIIPTTYMRMFCRASREPTCHVQEKSSHALIRSEIDHPNAYVA
ncbi:hypothetical protein CH063_08883 [Colletotrichum higginsianum]|uniref:Uncharacterized protein n=1 Tax=Colletotrichum higginsianum (strain IMI 349063) TaxID=759273 RepID=H1VBI2_COLHI|nr:hypothetical protein CH063_08883 [Colletotrichum higginsianum]